MNGAINQKEKMGLSMKNYQVLLDAYQKIGQVLDMQKAKEQGAKLKSLYGIWQGIKVEEKDFKEAEKSLFKTDL